MDCFPEDYYLHNLPLLLLSGLAAENQNDIEPSLKAHNLLQAGGFRIKIDAPLVQGNTAHLLQEAFGEQDASSLPWHSQSLAARNGRVFKITSVGRVGQIQNSLKMAANIHARYRHMPSHHVKRPLRLTRLFFLPLLDLEIHHHNLFSTPRYHL